MCAMAAVLFSLAMAPSAEGRQFTSGVNVVEVYAAVVDKAGNPVQGLKREDFTVLEDGRPQALSTFGEGDFPLSVALAIDHFGWLGVFFSLDLPASSTVTRELLGWRPTRLGLLEDLEQGGYFDDRAA